MPSSDVQGLLADIILLLLGGFFLWLIQKLRNSTNNLQRRDKRADLDLLEDETDITLKGAMAKTLRDYLERIVKLEDQVKGLTTEIDGVRHQNEVETKGRIAAEDRAALAELSNVILKKQIDLLLAENEKRDSEK